MKKNISARKNIATILALALLISTIGGVGQTDAIAKAKLRLNHKKLTMKSGKTATLTVSGVSSNIKVKWTITDKSVIKKVKTTKNKLIIKALKAGKSKVKVKVQKKTFTCTVTVSPIGSNSTSFETFAKKAVELIQNHQVQSSSAIAAADPFYTGRLIVRGKKAKLDFSKYSPKATLNSDDNTYLLQFDTSDGAKKAFQQISNSQDIEWVEPDAYIGTDTQISPAEASVSREFLSWGVSVIGADEYAAKTAKDEITVAVVDTGVSSHSFLKGKILSGIDYVDNDNDPSDLNSHGTHVSGTIVDCMPGLNVKILPVRVLNANGSGYMSTIAMGIRYAADNGAKVINLSLGGGHSSYVDSYIQYALDKGVTVVAAAGNNYSNTSSFCPAHINSIIVVGAIDDDEDKADFSNYGNSVDVVAPGVDVCSCIPGGSYAYYSGTSMATPHISACAAMIKLNHPSYTPSQIESVLRGCARDLGAAGWDMYYGAGVPDLTRINDSDIVPTATPIPTQKPTQTPIATRTPVPSSPATATPLPTRTPVYTIAPTYNPVPTTPPDQTGVIHDPSGYYYRVRSDQTAMITGYDGTASYLTIPGSLGGYTVRCISDGAFRNNDTIGTLNININCDISSEAFAGCLNLRTINIIGIVNSMGSRVFGNCTDLSYISINGMVFNSANDAFYGCTGLHQADVNGIIDNSVKSAISAAPGNPIINMIGIVT